MRRNGLVLVLLLLVAGCGETNDDVGSSVGPRPAGPVPQGCASGGGSAHVDWVDFIRLNDVTYDSNHYEQGLRKSDIGEPVAEVRCKISDNVTDPGYEVRDGDAAFLEPGALVYSVRGYPTWFRIAAKQEGEWVLYEPDHNPAAETGADLLDLRGHVRYIGINSSYNGTKELARIEDPDEVARLVEMVLSAPVDQERHYSDADLEKQVFIEFGFEDGTRSIRAFGLDSGQLQRGILTPPGFGEAIEQALQKEP